MLMWPHFGQTIDALTLCSVMSSVTVLKANEYLHPLQ